MRLFSALMFGVFALAAFSAIAQAELAVSGNDGKQMRPGDDPPGIRPDTISVLDLTHYPPKVLATIMGPASMIGPPDAVAVSRDESFAIVTDCQEVDPSDPTKLIASDVVSVVDLTRPNAPKIIQTAHAGAGASGVSINRAMTLALVASTLDNSVTVFSIRQKKLTEISKIRLDAKSGPTDVTFTPNGREALVVRRGDSKITVLSIKGKKVTNTGIDIIPGRLPYGVAIAPTGDVAFNTNHGVATNESASIAPEANRSNGPTNANLAIISPSAPHAEPSSNRQDASGSEDHPGGRSAVGAISVIDLKTNSVVSSVEVGAFPEHVALTGDGKYLEVNVSNNASIDMNNPNFNKVHGLMRVFAVNGTMLTPIAVAQTGHWCQGATWSKDDHTVLLQCAAERDIEVYRFDGVTLTRDLGATLKFDARPGAISTALSQ